MNLSSIKLIIWDLDETFWTGTLSEGDVILDRGRIDLIKLLTDKGIINSICSKNDFEQVKDVLTKYGIWEYFVFPRISWNPKGEIIRDIIAEMNLRSCNVAFIDDNPSNLNEAKYYSPELQVYDPSIIEDIYQQCLSMDKNDLDHKRLRQYKVLEKKCAERNKSSDNLEFLKKSDIRVKILTDCNVHIERIHEMIMRTNQLNFTKNRLTLDELIDLLSRNDVKCGYVEVTDSFGDYGISGFYSIEQGRLTNFLFSCRTMGMGVEQYVYAMLGFPELKVVGEVAYTLNKIDKPIWINQNCSNKSVNVKSKVNIGTSQIVIKGPCDMEQILGYINGEEYFISEFTFINPETGVSIESYNHTTHIVEAYELSEESKHRIIDELPFSAPEFFSNQFYSEKNKIVFYSMFTDPNLGLYKRKRTGEIVAFGEYCFDLTDPANWNGYMTGQIFNANCKFTKENLKKFAEKYQYIGRIEPVQVLDNLKKIRNYMSDNTLLVLFLGVEFQYPKNKQKSCEDRHIYNQQLNGLIREWASTESNVKLLEFGDFVKSPKDMLNNINHFIKPVYFQMSQRVIDLVNQYGDNNKVNRKSWIYMQKTYFTQANKLFRFYLKIRHIFAKLGGKK